MDNSLGNVGLAGGSRFITYDQLVFLLPESFEHRPTRMLGHSHSVTKVGWNAPHFPFYTHSMVKD